MCNLTRGRAAEGEPASGICKVYSGPVLVTSMAVLVTSRTVLVASRAVLVASKITQNSFHEAQAGDI